nr:hypothetical protein [Wolbachia pipientis]
MHNKGWIPVPSTGMTPVALRHTVTVSQPLTSSGMMILQIVKVSSK